MHQSQAVPTDEEIISAFGKVETRHKAFGWLLDKYHKRTYWHIRRIVISHDDADDVCQNTMVKIWENLDGFRSGSALYTWIFRIATNESITFLNKKKNNISLEDTSPELLQHLNSGQYFDGNKGELKLQQAILQLPEKQRIVFNMKYFDNVKYEEMSEILGTSVGALKASYHHAVKKIEDLLSKG